MVKYSLIFCGFLGLLIFLGGFVVVTGSAPGDAETARRAGGLTGSGPIIMALGLLIFVIATGLNAILERMPKDK